MEQDLYKSRWAQKWFENIQFIYGNQNLKWSKTYDFAVDVDFLTSARPAINQKSKTNLARVVAEALVSFIYSDLPTFTANAADESKIKSKRIAKICEKLLSADMEILCLYRDFLSAAGIFTAMGQVAAKIDHNRSKGQIVQIPQFQKVKAPIYTDMMQVDPMTGGLLEVPVQALDSMGKGLFEEKWEPVIGLDGRQVKKAVRAGQEEVRILTPFEYTRAPGSKGMHDTPWIEEIRILDYERYYDEYKDIDGKTKEFDREVMPLQKGTELHTFVIRQFMRLHYITPPTLDNNLRGLNSVIKGNYLKNKVIVIEHYDEPRMGKWDEGRRVITTNGYCTHITKPSYKTNKKDGWHPFAEAQWFNISPSSLAAGPLNDVIEKNRELNVKDSLIATALRRNMGSALLYRAGMGFDKNQYTGTPGEFHEVQDIEGFKFLHDTQPIPPVIESLRQQDKDDVYESSGAQDAIRGDRSKNVSAGYALKQLQEREEKRLTPPKREFERFVSTIGEKIIASKRSNFSRLSDDVIGYLKRAAAGEFTIEEVVGFLSSDIDYGVDIKAEPDSMLAKSQATYQANLVELGKGPLKDRLANDAQVLDEYIKEFGVEGLRDGSACHRDRAKRENEVFADMLSLGPDSDGLSRPVVCDEDDDDIHISEHTVDLVTNFEEISSNLFVLEERLKHIEMHRISSKEKAGKVAPGTTLNVPQAYAQARNSPAPQAPMIYQQNQQRQQQQQQQQTAQTQNPALPGGPKTTSTSAPSQMTPAAKSPPANSPTQGGTM